MKKMRIFKFWNRSGDEKREEGYEFEESSNGSTRGLQG